LYMLNPINDTGNSYSQAMELTNFKRLIFISGQVPEDTQGNVPDDFRSQCLLAWANIKMQLEAANMNYKNILKVTVFLSDRKFRDENAVVRKEMLGEHSPALTIIIAGIYEEKWLLEIEALAAE
jgi:2-iminobutanoate/2-iminopropanoate deaminase